MGGCILTPVGRWVKTPLRLKMRRAYSVYSAPLAYGLSAGIVGITMRHGRHQPLCFLPRTLRVDFPDCCWICSVLWLACQGGHMT